MMHIYSTWARPSGYVTKDMTTHPVSIKTRRNPCPAGVLIQSLGFASRNGYSSLDVICRRTLTLQERGEARCGMGVALVRGRMNVHSDVACSVPPTDSVNERQQGKFLIAGQRKKQPGTKLSKRALILRWLCLMRQVLGYVPDMSRLAELSGPSGEYSATEPEPTLPDDSGFRQILIYRPVVYARPWQRRQREVGPVLISHTRQSPGEFVFCNFHSAHCIG